MIIESSNTLLASAHAKVQQYESSEKLTAWTGGVKPVRDDDDGHEKDRVSLSKQVREYMEKEDDIEELMEKLSRPDRGMKIGLIKKLVEVLTGREIKIKGIGELSHERKVEHDDDDDHEEGHHHDVEEMDDHDSHDRFSWGVMYSKQESYYESEQMTFNAGGVVRTADGREINFSLDLMMSRELVMERSVQLAAAGLSGSDLALSFDGPASELSDMGFSFEMEEGEDSDGTGQVRNVLRVGTGALALDLNNDGQISEVNELIGASGDGFAELAAYDEDGNGWIDENDSIFSELKIMAQDENGVDQASGLLDSNVGAIHLGSVASPFTLTGNGNTMLGQIDRSGIYLNEDGSVGTVQQLSLVV